MKQPQKRWAFEPVGETSRAFPVYVRVQRKFRPADITARTDIWSLSLSDCYRLALRCFFGSYSSRQAARVLHNNRSSMHRWATGIAPVPQRAVQQLWDCHSEAARRRKAEIAARRGEFEAVIEQEEMLLPVGYRLLTRLMQEVGDPQARPDAISNSARMRYHRRRQEAIARPVPEPSALLQLFLAGADAALAASLAEGMHQPNQ